MSSKKRKNNAERASQKTEINSSIKGGITVIYNSLYTKLGIGNTIKTQSKKSGALSFLKTVLEAI